MTVEINPYATGWCYCGRRFSPTNEQVGTSCRGCLTEWVEDALIAKADDFLRGGMLGAGPTP